MLAALVLSSYGNASLKSVMTILTPEDRLESIDDVLKLDIKEVTVRTPKGGGAFHMLLVRQRRCLRTINDS